MKDTRRKKFIVGVIIAVVTILAVVGLPKLFSSIRKYYLKHPFKALGLPVSLKTIFVTITQEEKVEPQIIDTKKEIKLISPLKEEKEISITGYYRTGYRACYASS